MQPNMFDFFRNYVMLSNEFEIVIFNFIFGSIVNTLKALCSERLSSILPSDPGISLLVESKRGCEVWEKENERGFSLQTLHPLSLVTDL